MQKVIQRTANARKQAQSKLLRAQREEALADRKDTIRVRKDYNRAVIDNIKAARIARWEDWKKGALAPQRDVGPAARTFGSLDPALMHPPKIPKHLRRKHILFAAGDRVCVIRGRDQGKINEISQVNEDSETVLIKDVNMADINVPEWAKASMGIKSDVLAQSMPVPMDNIRHVIALEDANGNTRDHIVQHAYAGGPYLERPPWSKLPRYSRYVSGINIEIPWPTEAEPNVETGKWDTLLEEADEATWIPSLENSPFPPSVLDELRGKYSRFRTRHDAEYVREKVIEEYRQEYLQSQTLLTPKAELRKLLSAKSQEAKKAWLDADGNMQMKKSTADFIQRYLESNKVQKLSSKKVNVTQSA